MESKKAREGMNKSELGDYAAKKPHIDVSQATGCDRKKERRARGLALIEKQWERCGYKFIPLVTDKLCLYCSLDILFLLLKSRVYSFRVVI